MHDPALLSLEPITILPELAPTTELNLRNAGVQDVPRIYDLIKYWADKGRMLERSHALLESTIHEFLILETPDGQLAGCVGLHRMANDLAEVRGLAIHPSFQGRGLGRWLVLGAERMGRDWGLRRLFAWTYEQLFFEKCGYTRIPREETTLPTEIYGECQRCPFLTNCKEIPMLKMIDAPRVTAS
jgi:amino-acid N-acetyltransferase